MTVLQGRMNSWIEHELGLDPANLYPSVRCGLEGALLTALAQAHHLPLASLLGRQAAKSEPSADTADMDSAVLVNCLLDCTGDAEACQQEAAGLVAQGFTALKAKVQSSLVCKQASNRHQRP